MKKTKVNKLKQFKHKFDCMLCTILGHDPIKVFEQRERRHGHKTCLGGWVLAKVASQATLYNQWVHTMNANDVARNCPIGQM